MDGPLLVPHQDVADVAFVEFVIDIQQHAPRIAEDRVDTFLLQHLDQYFCSSQLHGMYLPYGCLIYRQ